MAIVVQDIERLNRLISDISDASRLDAELMRGEVKTVDLRTLLSDMVQHYAIGRRRRRPGSRSSCGCRPTHPIERSGHDGRYGQVFRNVIDNALSFSPSGSRIVVELTRERATGRSSVTIDDEGPGIPRTTSNRSSSASTPSGRPSISASIPASACRSAARSWRPTAARSAPPTARPRRQLLGARFTVRAAGGRSDVDLMFVHATCVACASARAGARYCLRGPSGPASRILR
jgi:two-component system sensor histidine kinase ChvG